MKRLSPGFERDLFEHLPVAALVVDENRRIRAINEEARKLTSWNPGLIGEATCRSLLSCRMPDARCPLGKVFSRRLPVRRAEVSVSTPRGKGKMIERISAFKGPNGERWAIILWANVTNYLKRLRRLRSRANVDPLTEVLSRAHFEELVSRYWHDERRKRPSVFIMVDVNGLKRVNETFGHAAGDKLLHRLGGLLRKYMRRGDLVGRLGGDEFGIYCPNMARSEAWHLIRRLRREIREDNARFPRHPELSIGVGVESSYAGGPQVRERADVKLREYKRKRRLAAGAAPAGFSALAQA